MIVPAKVVRSNERFMTAQPGIDSHHCFSAGAHYDPSRLGVGALIAVDEHVLAPGTGFAEHAHRGVAIVSWVVAGVLRHGADLLVRPGDVLLQSTGSGVRHTEVNGSDSPLRFIQTTLLQTTPRAPVTRFVELPLVLDSGRFDVHRSGARTVDAPAHLLIVHGEFALTCTTTCTTMSTTLGAGDSVTLLAGAGIEGTGELLVCELYS